MLDLSPLNSITYKGQPCGGHGIHDSAEAARRHAVSDGTGDARFPPLPRSRSDTVRKPGTGHAAVGALGMEIQAHHVGKLTCRCLQWLARGRQRYSTAVARIDIDAASGAHGPR